MASSKRDKALKFVEHIERHLESSRMANIGRGSRYQLVVPKVCCKICDKTIDEIWDEDGTKA